MSVRKAEERDLDQIARIYDAIHDEEEAGRAVIGWDRKIYPTLETAQAALQRGDLYVLEQNGVIAGAAVINQIQVDSYRDGNWNYEAEPGRVMVLHTLVIDPQLGGHGLGREFVSFYESYALSMGCPYLRMDTNERNHRARAMYRSLGYREAGIVPCVFNGIRGVGLVLLEKYLDGPGTENEALKG